jgi:hypothetical protein
MNYTRSRLRRAMSLIELMAGLSACSVILTTSAVLLHRVMRVESASRAFADVERSAARLSRQFRQDVHRASAAVLDPFQKNNGVALTLQFPNNQSLEYSFADGNITRIALQNGKIAAREEFAFPEDARLKFEEQQSPKRIVLSLTTPRETPTASEGNDRKLYIVHSVPLSLRVEVVVDRDHLNANSTTTEARSR